MDQADHHQRKPEALLANNTLAWATAHWLFDSAEQGLRYPRH
jgi:hypothetical protein